MTYTEFVERMVGVQVAGVQRRFGAPPNQLSTADLPAWAEGAEYPVLGDFAFYPEEGIDRATYTKVRDSKAPIFCYVQGMESMACVVKDAENGGFFKLGVQTFPG